MNLHQTAASPGWRQAACGVILVLLVGCATASVSWDERVGVYSWDDALTELGEPDRVTDLEGGVKAAEWVTNRSVDSAFAQNAPAHLRGEVVRVEEMPGRSAPPKVLRLSFTPDGKLLDWTRNY